MEIKLFADLLDFASDRRIREIDSETLGSFIKNCCSLLNLDDRELQEYIARDLRTRLIFHFIPAKILRQPYSDTAVLTKRDIKNFISERAPGDWKEKDIGPLVEILHAYSMDLPFVTRAREDYAEFLEEHHNCALCGFKFVGENESIRSDNSVDGLKPLTRKEAFQEPVVDHILPIKRLGSNRRNNLTVLCSQCNTGKSDYLSYSETRESSGYRSRKNFHSLHLHESDLRLFFSILYRDKACTKCGSTASARELTVAPKDDRKFFLFDNLVTVCYDCDSYERRWVKLPSSN
jgi:5-methylcytosine-specific restriction endonuclease McrA